MSHQCGAPASQRWHRAETDADGVPGVSEGHVRILLERFRQVLSESVELEPEAYAAAVTLVEAALESAVVGPSHRSVEMLEPTSTTSAIARVLSNLSQPPLRLAIEFSRRLSVYGLSSAIAWYRRARRLLNRRAPDRKVSPAAAPSPRTDTVHSRSRRPRGPPSAALSVFASPFPT